MVRSEPAAADPRPERGSEAARHPERAPAIDPSTPSAPLVRAAQAGDRRALEALVARALRLAAPIAAGVAGPDVAADVVQDAGVDVLRHIGALREPASFDAWARRIAVRRAVRAARRRRVTLRREESLDEAGPAAEPASAPPDSAELAVRTAVRSELRRLPARQRAAVILRYVEDLTEAQVADALGCPPGTVAALLSRARRALGAAEAVRALRPGEGER